MEVFVSRLKLAPEQGLDSFNQMFNPKDEGHAWDMHHRLIWSVFGDHKKRKRDFLFRQTGRSEFLSLSQRAPVASALIPDPDVQKKTLDFRVNDLITFKLQANATKRISYQGKIRRVDVVMDALHEIPGRIVKPGNENSLRAEQRMNIANIEGRKWLDRQGKQFGFTVENMVIEDYRQICPMLGLSRGRGSRVGILDIAGILRVAERDAFTSAVVNGVGRSRAFGCGLIVVNKIRRRA